MNILRTGTISWLIDKSIDKKLAAIILIINHFDSCLRKRLEDEYFLVSLSSMTDTFGMWTFSGCITGLRKILITFLTFYRPKENCSFEKKNQHMNQ